MGSPLIQIKYNAVVSVAGYFFTRDFSLTLQCMSHSFGIDELSAHAVGIKLINTETA